MQYHLENKILLNEGSECKSLYPWSLQEFDQEGKKVGCEMIPWSDSVYFTASEVRQVYFVDREKTPEKCELITGTLHSGTCGKDSNVLEDEICYSMFGTNRPIKHFDLQIRKTKEGEAEYCRLWGCVSYTSDYDFRTETEDDAVIIFIGVSPTRFDKISELIKHQRIDVFEVRLSQVQGFYSEWTPSIRTYDIKILTDDGKAQKVETNENSEITPFRLGDSDSGVDFDVDFNITVIQRHKINPKQDWQKADMDKLFDDSEDEKPSFMQLAYEQYHQKSLPLSRIIETESTFKNALTYLSNSDTSLTKKHKNIIEQLNRNSLVLSQLVETESTFKKIMIPMWLIFIALTLLLLK